ncbi:MAG: M67 family metallopeptidase [Anaerolineae bacterium]
MNITIGRALQQTIFSHLEEAYPNEGGGFLLGEVTSDLIALTDALPVANQFEFGEQWHRYAMSPLDWARLEDDAEARGLSLVGYYHSHPNARAIPSVFDRDHALPNFVYLITAVAVGPQAEEQRAWLLRPDRTAFDELQLVVVHSQR